MTDPVKAKANFLRVCQLLVDKGGDALRKTLHAIHPPSTLAAVLNANKSKLQRIRYSVIKQSQWDLLFPVSGVPDSNNFDITLLTILLRNICGLPSPTTGWNVMPPVSDSSISGNIARIKIFRNDVYGHIPVAQLDETTFETIWQDISKPLVMLGIPQQEIDELKEATLTPEEDIYIKKLKEWKQLEDNIKSKVNDLERAVTKLQKTIEHDSFLQLELLAKFDFTGKIDGLSKKFQSGTRQWFFDKLFLWFTDQTSRVMILTAGPGAGKSVLSATICEMYKQRGQLAAYHFCDFRNSDSRNPQRILQSLASQMCDNVERFRDTLAEVLRREHSRHSLSDAFRVLLNDPLHALDRQEAMLIVVDALDESKTDARSDFLELISDEFPELPEWIKIFITTRPELKVRKKLQHLNPVEISADHHDHNLDIEYFICHSLPKVNEGNVHFLIRKCEGSFLYAYYLVDEVKKMDLGIEPDLSDYVSKGISGFYEKQFKRLRTGLQSLKPDTWSFILKCFINVIAASEAPVPVEILFTCMDLSDEEFEIREEIMQTMSEILPLYEDCLTVYHKSLRDWLVLDGYVEHAFKADVVDGTGRLWRVCKSIYSEINLLRLVSDFQISSMKSYALLNGGNILSKVGATEDFDWLNVKVNFLKLKFFDTIGVNVSKIIKIYKSQLSDCIFLAMLQLDLIQDRGAYQYLQLLASGFSDTSPAIKNYEQEARNILEKSNKAWVEEVRNKCNSNFKTLSRNVITIPDFISDKIYVYLYVAELSPDNKLLACNYSDTLELFNLPDLKRIFRLEINAQTEIKYLVFSPDSSYLLTHSLRTCISLTEQKEVPFIPHGPEYVDFCSFSSCGLKLVVIEKNLIKVWDVKTKNILVEAENAIMASYCKLSNCNSYIIAFNGLSNMAALFDFRTSTWLKAGEICTDTCLTYQDHFELILTSSENNNEKNFKISHIYFPAFEKLLVSINRICSKPFRWKRRKCVLLSESYPYALPLVVYDFINNEVIDELHIKCFPNDSKINYIANLNETHFLICLDSGHLFLLSYETSEESLKASFVNFTDVECCVLSPDNFYMVCCYKNSMAVRSVDTGETLQTVELRQPAKACWWSDLYLWVICESVLVKYPYDSTQRTQVLGSELEECALDFDKVLKFERYVLVICYEKKITILKFSNKVVCSTQMFSLNYFENSAAVSSDGRAVLLYDRQISRYQLWEITCDNKWELHSAGRLTYRLDVEWLFLTGITNSRRLLHFRRVLGGENCQLSSIDFLSNAYYTDFDSDDASIHYLTFAHFSFNPHVTHKLDDVGSLERVIHGDSKYLIIADFDGWLDFVEVSTGKITTSIYLGYITSRRWTVSSFYIPSRSLLVLVGKTEIITFKIHNVEKY